MRRTPALLAAPLLTLALTGCGASPSAAPSAAPSGSPSASASGSASPSGAASASAGAVGPVAPRTLEDQVAVLLAEQTGQLPDEVTCPDPLPAETGAEVRCVLLDGETELGLTVTARDVRLNTVDIGVVVDEVPVG